MSLFFNNKGKTEMITRDEITEMIAQENKKVIDLIERLSELISQSNEVPSKRSRSKPSQEFCSANEICTRLSIARSTINKWQEDRHFPMPIKIGSYCNRWRRVEVDAWVEENLHGR